MPNAAGQWKRDGCRLTSGQNESKQQGHGRTKTKSDMFFHARMRISAKQQQQQRSKSSRIKKAARGSGTLLKMAA